MIILLTGGSASGKSGWAEGLAAALHRRSGGALIYLATMAAEDGESRRRVARHRAQRAGRGFLTVERPAGDTAGPEGYRLAGSGGLAFDHGRILAWALRRLRREVETSRLPFHLLPERFTLTQLQQVCETMLGRPLLKAAFRRKIAPLVEDTGEYAQRAGHRPARLYRRKEQER